MKKLIRDFENPGSRFRGKPFWAWNGRLEEAELRRQIRIMKRMGLGGFFMHSRTGLTTPYLSREWFLLVKACVDEARRSGMEAWLYDEDRWPSGAAGGLVTRDPRYRQRRLQAVVWPAKRFRWSRKLMCAWAAEVDGTKARAVWPLKRGERPPKDAPHVIAFQVVLAPTDPWYNGCTYLDTLSEPAVRAFVRSTHDAYAKHVGKDFGRHVPGIFTDEPNFGWLEPKSELPAGAVAIWEFPWTDRLFQVFRRAYGYDLRDHLPELFFHVEGIEVSCARYHYRDCLTRLFANAFARISGEWCERHGIALTGHALLEETLATQTWTAGSVMRFYEHMQMPGIDNLTENNYEFDTAKQCSSVARQMGRRWILSELYGCTGWDFPFEGHKADGDWQAALGVNVRCPHLSWYTMLGEAKRDYPASIFYQSPWWESYAKVEDYFARIHTVMTRGEPVRHLLVIHPIESMWLEFDAGWRDSERVKRLDRRFAQLRDWLLQEHLDFDYGDEEMLGRLGKVRRSAGRAMLRVGKADYRSVLVPPLRTIRSSTLDVLDRFQRARGQVVFAGPPPTLVDAVSDESAVAAAARSQKVAFNRRAVCAAVAPAVRAVSLVDADGREVRSLMYLLREDRDAHYLFVANLDRKRGRGAVEVRLQSKGSAEQWDPETSRRFATEQRRVGGELRIRADFPPTGSRLFVIRKKGKTTLPRRPKYEVVDRRPLRARPDWIALDEPNVLVLDRPSCRIHGGRWQEPAEILKIDQAVRRALGVPLRGGFMVQPWARPPAKRQGTINVELRYAFDVRTLPSGPIDLAMERPQRFSIALNGHAIDCDKDCGWWVDPSIRRLPIDPAALLHGRNEIVLSTAYTEDNGLEAMFLLGNFGVAVEGESALLTSPVKRLRLGDWTIQGLPFYSAAVTYGWRENLKVNRAHAVFVRLPRFEGTLVRVIVNGSRIGEIAWQPHELEITDAVVDGENDLRTQVVSSRRNSFGPLHRAGAESRWTGPREFITTGERWNEEYSLRPYGLYAPPLIEYRRP